MLGRLTPRLNTTVLYHVWKQNSDSNPQSQQASDRRRTT